MRKNLKKIFAFITAFTLITSGLTTNVYGQSEIELQKMGDPFKMMVETSPQMMTVEEIIQTVTMRNNGRTTVDTADIVLKPSDFEDIGEVQNAVEDSIKNLNKSGSNIEINYKLLDTIFENQKRLIEQSKTDRYIVKYKDHGEDSFKKKVRNEILNTVKINKIIAEELKTDNVNSTELIVLKNRVNPSEFAKTLRSKNAKVDIEYIQPDFQMELNSLENSMDDNPVIDATTETTGAISKESPGELQKDKSLIAVIDTGMDITHPDLNDYIYVNQAEIPDNGRDDDGNGYIDDVNGWNFPDNSGEVYDVSLGLDQAHATHIAGIVTGLSDADASLTPNENIKILPLKVFKNGLAYTSDIIAAIEYADMMGAKVVNCSFGSTIDNPALKEAMEKSGMLFVCSAGNARNDLAVTPIFPACFDLDNTISVTSTNSDGCLSYFSNYSSAFVDVAALGRDINSTLPNGKYGLQTGSSMSTALVSSIAAWVLSSNDMIESAEMKERLLNSSDKLSNLQETVENGRRINASNAIKNLTQANIIQNSPENDFEVTGYNPTQNELYQLYSSGTITKIASGDNNTIALKNDGTVWAWGDNSAGQCGNGSALPSVSLTQVIGLNNVIGLSADGNHCLAVKTDGTVWAWGQNGSGQLGDGTTTNKATPVQVSGLTGVASVSAGANFSMALKSDGTVWAWGYNSYGNLGDGTTINKSTPVQVSGLTGIVNISAGGNHGLAVKSTGAVYSWGYNSNGQLGDGTTTNKTVPVQISSLTGVASVSAGYKHSLAVKSNGTVLAWGYNSNGQLGDGTTTSKTTPVQVNGLTGVSSSAANYNHSVVLKSDGTAWAWGDNGPGQLGDGTTVDKSTPVRVTGLTNATFIDAGFFCSFAVKTGGTVWAWGSNQYGQLGDGMPASRLTPVKISSLTGISSAVAGESYSHAVKTDGTVWSWGSNMDGYLGDGTKVSKGTPFQVSGLTGVSNITAYYHSLAVKTDGTVRAWGLNLNGELGDGTTTDRTTPVQVSNLTGAVGVSAGDSHSLALKSGGTVWAWGYNSNGQLGDGTTTAKTTPIQVSGLTGAVSVSAGEYHSMALKSDGTVRVWGKNTYGQLGDGTTTKKTAPVQVSGLTGVIGVAAGASHSIAVKSDGTVWAWGRNNYGQLGDGTVTNKLTPVQVSGLTGVVRVAAGEAYSLAVKSDGTVWAWGNNSYGQLGDGTLTDKIIPVQVSGLAGITSVEGGYDHSLALKSDGTVWSWGSDESGQLGLGRVLQSNIPIQSQAYVGTISFQESSYAADIPHSGQNTIIISANGIDSFGNPIPSSGIRYALQTTYSGVSIDILTGVVTISSSAQAGSVQVTATYQNLTCSTAIVLTVPIIVFENNTYDVPLKVSDITDFSGKSFTLTYNASILELIDLSTFTKTKETTTGVVTGTGITISGASQGSVTMQIDKAITSGKKWSGAINVLRFKVKATGDPNINFVYN